MRVPRQQSCRLDDGDAVELESLHLFRCVDGQAVEAIVELHRCDDGMEAGTGSGPEANLVLELAEVGARGDDRVAVAFAHRTGARGGAVGGHEMIGQGHDGGRRAVVHLQRHLVPSLRGELVEHVPASRGSRCGGLELVTHDGHRPRRDPTHQQTPLHGGQFLGFVDDGMSVHPLAIGEGPLGDRSEIVPTVVAVEEVIGTHTGAVGGAFGVLGLQIAVGHTRAGVARSEQLGQFVQQRDVGHSEPSGEGRITGQEALLVDAEQTAGGSGETVGFGVQPFEETFRADWHPHRVEYAAGLRSLADLVEDLGAFVRVTRVDAALVGQFGGDLVHENREELHAGHVVTWIFVECASGGIIDGLGRHLDGVGPEGDADPLVGTVAVLPYGVGHHFGHGEPGFHLCGGGVIDERRGHPGVQVGHGGQHDTGLTEGRENVVDVFQEARRRSDDEDTCALEAGTVAVQQISGAVQGHDGLARSRSPVDHEDARGVRTHNGVLFGLDRLDDLTHLAGTGPVQGGEQHAVAGQGGRVDAVEVEDVVVQCRHPPVVGGDVTTAGHTHGVRR